MHDFRYSMQDYLPDALGPLRAGTKKDKLRVTTIVFLFPEENLEGTQLGRTAVLGS